MGNLSHRSNHSQADKTRGLIPQILTEGGGGGGCCTTGSQENTGNEVERKKRGLEKHFAALFLAEKTGALASIDTPWVINTALAFFTVITTVH